MAGVSVDYLQQDLTPQDYLTLTLGDDANAERAIEKAAVWSKGKILSTGGGYDEENDVVKQIISARALYELYFFVGYPEKARQKAEDAADLIKTYFGNIKTKYDDDTSGSQGPYGPQGGAVKETPLPRYGS